KLLWRTQEPQEAPYFSAASSPVAEGGLVIAHPGSYGPLTAFDVNTGEVRWTAGDGGFFVSPIVVTLGGIRQAITVTQKSVIGVGIPDGKLLWSYAWPGGSGGTMPILHGDVVLVSEL